MKTNTLRLYFECLTGGALLFLAGLSLAFAQNMDPADPTSPPGTPTAPATRDGAHAGKIADDGLARGDRRFLKQATRLGEQEVTISRIAADRAIHPQVRNFASEMVREHTAANEELAALVKRKGAVVEPRDRTDIRGDERKWAAKKGDDFDEDYLEAIIDGHQDTIDVLENGAESKDPAIAAYAAKYLPVVKTHLARAESLKEAID